MSLFNDASLIVTPNGYKAGKLYSLKPFNGSGDLTVVRNTTATRVNSSGLIESVASNVPRLDYTGGSCPSILVEPQRTNLALRSEEFENAAWGKLRSTISANSLVSPDGNTNADTLVANVDTAITYGLDFSTLTGTGIFTASVFAKKGSVDWMYIRQGNSGGGTTVARAWFDLNNGTIGITSPSAISHKIEDYGNGWYRCSMTFEVLSGGIPRPQFYISNGDGVAPFDSDGTQSINIWGAQLEEGSYATSYIKTTSASVTRNADVISKTGISSLIGQSEGTLFVDFDFDGSGFGLTNDFFLYVGDGANTDSIYIDYFNNIFRWVVFNGSTLAFYTDLATTNGRHKLALGYKAGQYVAYADGNLILADTNATAPPTCAMLSIAQNVTGFGSMAKEINAAALWKTRLTNAQLASLTTI
jgi:hypothetical protein